MCALVYLCALVRDGVVLSPSVSALKLLTKCVCACASCVRSPQCCKKQYNYENWKHNLSSSSMAQNVTDHLINSIEQELPELKRDRTRPAYAFRNGIYDCFRGRFFKYGETSELEDVVCIKDWKTNAPDVILAAPTFEEEADLDETEFFDWYNDIPTPHFDTLINFQFIVKRDGEVDERETEMVRRWMYVFMGRLLYPVKEHDDWQVMCFLKGVAGSGKSTICRVAQWLFRNEEVAIISNNIERKFGLSSLYDKDLVLCYEARHDMALDQV